MLASYSLHIKMDRQNVYNILNLASTTFPLNYGQTAADRAKFVLEAITRHWLSIGAAFGINYFVLCRLQRIFKVQVTKYICLLAGSVAFTFWTWCVSPSATICGRYCLFASFIDNANKTLAKHASASTNSKKKNWSPIEKAYQIMKSISGCPTSLWQGSLGVRWR